MPLHTVTVRVREYDVIKVSGELDIATAPTLRDAVTDAVEETPQPRVILDMSSVTFMDSMGLGGVLTCYRIAREQQGRLALVNPTPRVTRVLKVTCVIDHLPVFDTVGEAIAAW